VVTRPSGTPLIGPTPRPLWGLRHRPGRLALAVFRIPLRTYNKHPERMPGQTFLKFIHAGRKTGRAYEAVAMVLRYDELTHEAVICAAWGNNTDWVRNLRAAPATQVQVGPASFTPEQRFLTDDEACDVLNDFRHAHPIRLWLFRTVLGWGNLRDAADVRSFVHTHPCVAFRPTAAH